MDSTTIGEIRANWATTPFAIWAQRLPQWIMQAQQHNEVQFELELLAYYAECCFELNEYNTIPSLVTRANTLNGDSVHQQRLWYILAASYFEVSNFADCLRAARYSIELAQTQQNQEAEIETMLILAKVFLRQSLIQKGLDLIVQYDENHPGISSQTKFKLFLCRGSLYHSLGEDQLEREPNNTVAQTAFKEALYAYQKAMEYLDGGKIAQRISLGNNIANTLKRLGRFQEALEVSKHSLRIAENLGDARRIGMLHLNIGRLYLELDSAYAEVYLKNALLHLEPLQVHELLLCTHNSLVRLYKELKNPEAALFYLEQARAIEKQKFDTEIAKQTQDLALQLQLQQVQHESELQRIRTHELEQHLLERTMQYESAQFEILERLVDAGEFRDKGTGMHTRRVGLLAEKIALALEFDTIYASRLGMAARLHDIGKLAVPDTMLFKSSPLNTAEWDVMRHHPVTGAQLLGKSQLPLLQLASEVALTHHERFDGTGYPYGIAGQNIPISGRIVAVADAFDAITHKRSYKPALESSHALQEIKRNVGTHFDGAVVYALETVLRVNPNFLESLE